MYLIRREKINKISVLSYIEQIVYFSYKNVSCFGKFCLFYSLKLIIEWKWVGGYIFLDLKIYQNNWVNGNYCF